MKMRRYFFLFMILFSSGCCLAESAYQLVLEKKDGSTIRYVLSDKPVVTFAGTQVQVKSAKAETSYERSDVSRYYFEDVANGIDVVTDDDSSLRIDYSSADRLTAYGLSDAGAVGVYDLAGRLAPAGICVSDNAVTIDLSVLPAGVYVITLPNHPTLKIKKQ